MRIHLDGVTKHFGAQLILDHATLTVGTAARVGVVGPNGVGKSTLLRILAGVDEPDQGSVLRAPERLTAGYLAQARGAKARESVLEMLARRTGVAAAEHELHEAASALARDSSGEERYTEALETFVGLGGGDFEARVRTVCAELGLAVGLDRRVARLSGGEAARAALASILLSRFDVLLLDEPTNDLDFGGLARLERFLDSYEGALVIVSHDRALLDRTVNRIVGIDPSSHHVHEWSGNWSDFAAAREVRRRAAYAQHGQAVERRRELSELLRKRRTEARGKGDSLGRATGGADRRATHALKTKVRQAERRLAWNELPEKPFEPWELQLSLDAESLPGVTVLRLDEAVALRGPFLLGPLSIDLAPGERLAVTGRNGTGKTTLLGLLTGDVPLTSGRRFVGPRTTIGTIAQQRRAYTAAEPLVRTFRSRTMLAEEPARTLLAKFGLGADHVGRPGSSLSPGERTRAHLAELQSRRVNVLILDEPTNHLDLEAVEQLESALGAYGGTLVVVSHDRRFLEAVAPTREIGL